MNQSPGQSIGRVAATVATAIVLFALGQIAAQMLFWSNRPSYYSAPGPSLGLLLALAAAVPILWKIWARPALTFATYAALVAAFICLWTAASGARQNPFTDDQWRLLGLTFLAVGGVLGWSQREVMWRRR